MSFKKLLGAALWKGLLLSMVLLLALLAGLLGRKKGKRQANRRQKGERPRAAAGRKRR